MDVAKPVLASNDSNTTKRVSSPFNPSNTVPSSGLRPRSRSMSSPRSTPSAVSTSNIPSMSLTPPRSTLNIAVTDDDEARTVHSRTPSMVVVDTVWKKVIGYTPTAKDDEDKWKNTRPKSKIEIPPEQQAGWDYTKRRVMQAAVSVLGTTADITHEALILSTELLEFAPIPGLQNIAKTLLHIWDSLQEVDMHRLQCLHLTERCADILLSVCQEIHDAGDQVGEELALPIQKLAVAFRDVFVFLQKQIHRPFLKRYLKRDEIQREIAGCDQSLHEALGMFSLSIQIRILKQVQESDRRRERDMQTILAALGHASVKVQSRVALPTNALGLEGVGEDRTDTTPKKSAAPLPIVNSLPSTAPDNLSELSLGLTQLSLSGSATPLPRSPDAVLSALSLIVSKQNAMDADADMAQLRNVLRSAIATGSDLVMLETLGVGRDEMAEAVKTLQRALERAADRKDVGGRDKEATDGEANLGTEEDAIAEGSARRLPSESGATGKRRLVKMARRLSTQGSSTSSPSPLKRSRTVNTMGSSGSGSSGEEVEDTLDREFLESGIDALRRMSEGTDATLSLPSWTITKFEVERTHKVGIGFFSDVYSGIWRGRTVAIKVLAQTTPRDLFIKEVEIWKKLRHPNVLELYGASSASGDPPWFLVSAYLKEGTLVEFLRKMEGGLDRGNVTVGGKDTMQEWRTASQGCIGGTGLRSGLHVPGVRGRSLSGSSVRMIDPKGCDLLKFIYEIAKGMAYLHSQGVLHGDLKASNVLVTDRHRCVITDFGQSEMRSEAFRISGTIPPHGTLRWQAPELMTGVNQLTTESDVYAFAICCIEVLSMGRMPWPLADDLAVRHFVLNENVRPSIPISPFNSPALQDLLRKCWHRDPFHRPAFSRIVGDIKTLRRNQGIPDDMLSPQQSSPMKLSDERVDDASPDMQPMPIPAGTPPRDILLGGLNWQPKYDKTKVPQGSPATIISRTVAISKTARESSFPPAADLHMTGGMVSVSRATSVSRPRTSVSESTASEEDSLKNLVESDGYDSPQPAEKRIADARDERRYRLLLAHGFHPSLVLPLWGPTPVSLGAVGYLLKPEGTFVTLFNAINPAKTDELPDGMATVWGFGKVSAKSQRVDTRSAAQKGIDVLAGMFNFRKGKEADSTRRYSHPLRAGHKTAFLYTESTTYKYIENLDAPKQWFKSNVEAILKACGDKHRIQKEDLLFVIGTLNTSDYALFVSHNHPDGQAHVNILPAKMNQPWSVITTSNEVAQGGPSYDEPIPGGSEVHTYKSSMNGDGETSVLLARLRFKTDRDTPTSL